MTLMYRLLISVILFLLPSLVIAGDRYALIIGNDEYFEVSTLEKAVADAQAMNAELSALGFETTLATNVGRRAFNIAVAEFTRKLSPGDTAVVFYAGHGVEIDGENYLLPTDIIAPSDVQKGLVSSESVALSSLLERVRATGVRTTLAFIDACRDNPFASKAGRSIGSARGLARIAAPEGTFVVYSAGAGQQALDRLDDADTNANSVFTRNLLPKLSQPGLELRDLVADLRVEVRDLARTRNHAQFPAYYDELLGDFYFKAAARVTPPSTSDQLSLDTPQAVAQSSGSTKIRDDFELARQIGTESALRSFLTKYQGATDDFTIDLAEQMLADMDNSGSSSEPGADTTILSNTEPSVDTALDPRELVRLTQIELNRVGCSAGVADGLVGRRTRDAFSSFIGQNGSNLSMDDLGSAAALEVVRAASGTVCQSAPRTVAPDDSVQQSTGPTLAGTWSFRYNCAIVISGTGTSTVTKTGSNTYSSRYTDSNGTVGSASYARQGQTTYSGTTQNSVATASETIFLSADGNSYSSTNSLGCRSTGTRIR
jgi:hypothetical protein